MPRWVRLLLVLLALNLSISVAVRGADLVEVLTTGPDDWADWVSAIGFVLVVPVVLLAAFGWQYVDTASAEHVADRNARDQLRAELHTYTATSHEWLWQTDETLTVTFSSPAVADLLGVTSEQLVGRDLLGLLHPDDAGTLRAIADRAAVTGTGWRDVELRWQHLDGHVVTLQGSGDPVVDPRGGVVGFRGTRRAAATSRQARQDREAAATRVRHALAAATVQVALQPIVDLAGHGWAAAEALARFPDGRGPDRWFEDAHLAGLGTELELLCLDEALLLLVPDDGSPSPLPPEVTLSVNASPSLILDPRLRASLVRLGPALSRLTLEITEHAEVTAYDDIHDALTPLRERGMRLAVDDTGAGYASFAHVLKLRPDEIKLDRSLVTGIDGDAARRAFVTAIVILALELGAVVTGEGVETAAELRALGDLGVDQAQGYHLARPTVSRATWTSWRTRAWAPAASAPVAPLRAGERSPGPLGG